MKTFNEFKNESLIDDKMQTKVGQMFKKAKLTKPYFFPMNDKSDEKLENLRDEILKEFPNHKVLKSPKASEYELVYDLGDGTYLKYNARIGRGYAGMSIETEINDADYKPFKYVK